MLPLLSDGSIKYLMIDVGCLSGCSWGQLLFWMTTTQYPVCVLSRGNLTRQKARLPRFCSAIIWFACVCRTWYSSRNFHFKMKMSWTPGVFDRDNLVKRVMSYITRVLVLKKWYFNHLCTSYSNASMRFLAFIIIAYMCMYLGTMILCIILYINPNIFVNNLHM